MRRRTLLLAITAAILALPTAASAAGLVALAPSSAWQSSPIAAASPPGDQTRLFVVERGGGVRIVDGGVLLPTPFLTVPNVDTGGERGLLSIAFAPDYASSGLFYVFTVAKGGDALDPTGEPGDVRVVEYRRSAADPNLADPASARLVIKQAHDADNHNGGQIAFGPDDLLYVTIGDNANPANAQDLSNDLGKVLRIDPREQPGGAQYGIPASNPFVAAVNAKPEIYARGLRNPYRASFAPNGDFVLSDVGAGTWEEVNVGRATGTPTATTLAGANLGWPNCEGVCTPSNPSFFDPFFQYGHPAQGGPLEKTGCAIIGGYVVGDRTLTGLTGRYLYGDTCRRDLRSLDLGVAGADPQPVGLSLPEASVLIGFGEDGRGCVYAMTSTTVFRVAPTDTDAAACPEAALAGGDMPAPPAAADTTRPDLTLGGSHRQPLRRSFYVSAACDEACALRARGPLRFAGAFSSAAAQRKPLVTRRAAAAAQRLRLPVKLRRSAYRRAKRGLDHGERVTVRITVSATDASGNRSEKLFLVRTYARDAAT